MKKLLLFLTLFLPTAIFAQTSVTGRIDEGPLAARPTVCSPGDYYVTTDTNPVVEYKCSTGNIWNQEAGGGGGGTPGGVNGDTQCKNGAIFVACGQNTAILYVSTTGNDTNSGKTWDTAKLTIMAAICALPGGNCSSSPKQAGGGTVYFANGVSCNSVATGGCWIAANGDSQYPSMASAVSGPTAWTTVASFTALNFICAANEAPNGAPANRPTCSVVGPNHTAGIGNLPLFWATGSVGFYISGMSGTDGVNYTATWGRVGIDSTTTQIVGVPTVTQTTSWTIENSLGTNFNGGVVGVGPQLAIGNGFWEHMRDDSFTGNNSESCQITSVTRTSNVATVTTNNCGAGGQPTQCPFLTGDHLSIRGLTDGTLNGTFTAASSCGATNTVTFNQTGPNSSASVGSNGVISDDRAFGIVCYSTQIEMARMHDEGNGIKFYSGPSSALELNDIYMEGIGTETQPHLWISPLIYGGGGVVDLSGLFLADVPTLPTVITDPGGPVVFLHTQTSQGTDVQGPMITLGGGATSFGRTTGLLPQGQSGWTGNQYFESQNDISRRQAPVTSNLSTNIVPQNPTAWTGSSFTTASGKPDPFAGTGAIEIDATASTTANLYTVTQAINVGDLWYFGGWVRAPNGTLAGGHSPFNFVLNANGFGANDYCTNGTQAAASGIPFVGDGNWFWTEGVCIIWANPNNAGIQLQIGVDSTHPAQVYRPFLFRIPVGTLTPTEVADQLNSLGFGPSTQAGAGDISFPSDKKLCLPSGSATNEFCAYLAHNNTANRSYTLPDQSGGTFALETAPSNIAGQLLTAQNAAPANFLSPGISDGNGGSSITTTPYTIQCDSPTGLIDRAKLLRFQNGAATVTVPQSTVTGCLGGFVVSVVNDGAGPLTFNRTGTDTFSIFTGGTFFSGSTSLDNQTSFSLTNGQYATLNQGAVGIWEVRISTNPFPNGNVISANNPPQNVSAVPMVPGTQIFGCTVTNTSNQISNCPLPVPTAAAVGWLVHITNGCCGGLDQVGSVYLLPLNGSTENIITGSCGANCFTVSQNATGSASGFGHGSAIVTVGPDSTTAATNITNYLNGSQVSGQQCPSVFLGSGIYMVKSAEFNITGAGCLFPLEGGLSIGTRTSMDTQAAFLGYQAMAGMLAPTQDFNFTTCTGGPSGKACFFSGHGIRSQNIGINGGGASLTGGNHNNIIVEVGNDGALYMFICQSWGSSDTSLIGVQQAQGAQAIVTTQLDGCGQVGLNVTDTLPAVFSSGFVGDNSNTNVNVAANAQFNSASSGFAGILSSSTSVTDVVVNGTWFSSNDNAENYATSTQAINVNSGGIAHLTNFLCTQLALNNSCLTVQNGGKAYFSNSIFKATGTGLQLNAASGALLFDNGGNTSSGGAGFGLPTGTYVANPGPMNNAIPAIASGFGSTPSIFGSALNFRMGVGSGGTATTGTINLPTAPTGWNCNVQDSSSNIPTRQSANTVSSITVTATSAWGSGDTLLFVCGPY